MKVNLIHGDCLEKMADIEDGSVDMILADPPYGTTACKWDSIIPLEPMWEQLKRVIKPNGAIAICGSEPFSSTVRTSNLKNYKYDWIWNKVNKFTGYQIAKIQPMRDHENVMVFCNGKTPYNRQMRDGEYTTRHVGNRNAKTLPKTLGFRPDNGRKVSGLNPKMILDIPAQRTTKGLHPTQKPVALMEYLVKTYTNEGETVLDFTMGSGTTGVACKNLNRSFIGIEMDDKYFELARERINEA